MLSELTTFALAVALAFVQVNAESHTVTFNNRCGYGTPYLRASNGAVLSTGGSYTSNGALVGAIAYVPYRSCGNNGEECTLIETTLQNGYSSTDISLIPPHEFSVTSGFGYYDGCDGAGADCTYGGCPDAFYTPDQTWVQVGCPDANVNLAITFCD
ncbi:hypothetical protein IEO21_01339 [Rhodonia placenta]|uniref:Glycopeptide n=1 Tax=Rhodonia placenta TaxID=104341 RepID=A0A8H7U600_9APHY|nr:hypothetical protein IEO21_01339 [Postia placenta]